MKTECPNCGSRYDVEAKCLGQRLTCPDCGNEFEAKNAHLFPCPDCFVLISKRARVCPHCGAELSAAPDAAAPAGAQPQEEDIADEKEIMVCHPSAFYYLGGIIFGIVTIPLLIGILLLAYIWINIHYTIYTVTSLRIIARRGWIAKSQDEIWIKDIRGVNLAQSIWQRIIDVGNIFIGTAATAGTEICMTAIDNPQKAIDAINSLRQ